MPLSAAVRLPHIFGENMVLQREKPVPVWGWANPGEAVKVQYGQQEKRATADVNGRWMVRLAPMPADKTGGELVVTGENTITFKNVLVGEVWLCSGQSNMEMGVEWVLNGAAEVAAAAETPMIRYFKTPYVHSPFPQSDVEGRWQAVSPATVGGCTAAGYFFARELVKNLEVPVGVIDSSWGGTPIEAWTSREGLAAIPELKAISRSVEDAYPPDTADGRKRYQEFGKQFKDWLAQAEKTGATGKNPAAFPVEPWLVGNFQQTTHLFNAKINPLAPYAIRGALWYQGEYPSEGNVYFNKMRALIGSWRQVWQQGDFPFYFVQLPNFQRSDPNNPAGCDGWAGLRDAQLQSLAIPNTGMAVTIDLGDATDIHPKNKQDVGKRLAAWALAKDYGKTIECSGPLYRKHMVEGDKIRIFFDHAASGLMVGEKSGLAPVKAVAGGKVKWLAIAGEDKRFFWADATIDGQTLVVSCKDVPKPVAVRYAFTMNPEGAGLYNQAGLPASPFATDAR